MYKQNCLNMRKLTNCSFRWKRSQFVFKTSTEVQLISVRTERVPQFRSTDRERSVSITLQ